MENSHDTQQDPPSTLDHGSLDSENETTLVCRPKKRQNMQLTTDDSELSDSAEQLDATSTWKVAENLDAPLKRQRKG